MNQLIIALLLILVVTQQVKIILLKRLLKVERQLGVLQKRGKK